MSRNLLGSRARQAATGLALCTLAAAAQADPFSLEGVCHLTSLIPGQGQCLLEFSVSDPVFTVLKSATVRIDNIIVHRYLNDTVHPAANYYLGLTGTTEVSCGVSHVVTAFIVRVPVGSLAEKVGSLPAILCPTKQ